MYKTITAKELKEKIKSHQLWLYNAKSGNRLVLNCYDLNEANLSAIDLSKCDLSGSCLIKSDLSGSDLCDSNLSNTDLRGCNLQGSRLNGCNLNGSDLRRSNLWGTNLTGSGLIVFEAGAWAAYVQADFIRIGCQYHSVEQWRNFTDDEINEMSVNPSALTYWERYKAIILSMVELLQQDKHRSAQ